MNAAVQRVSLHCRYASMFGMGNSVRVLTLRE